MNVIVSRCEQCVGWIVCADQPDDHEPVFPALRVTGAPSPLAALKIAPIAWEVLARTGLESLVSAIGLSIIDVPFLAEMLEDVESFESMAALAPLSATTIQAWRN
jgi:hypothetical protein